jgi:hypothetical protein
MRFEDADDDDDGDDDDDRSTMGKINLSIRLQFKETMGLRSSWERL